MSEAVTMPNVMMMTLIVSEESLARDIHTHTHTHTDTHAHTHTDSVLVIFLKVCFAYKNEVEDKDMTPFLF